MSRLVWVDASAGVAGDMLLGALLDAGVPIEVVRTAVDAVAPERVTLTVEEVRRAGLRAVRCHVEVADSATQRTWRDIQALLAEADLAPSVRDAAYSVFLRLAEAEAHVHGMPVDEVHFHEVGALDAIADVVGVCAALGHLDIKRLVVSPVGVGSGSVVGEHGVLPVPPPAVARLLRGAPSQAGPARSEACTPTGAALLTALGDDFGPQPAMTVAEIGVGAGGRDPSTHANVVRVLVGEPPDDGPDLMLLETNVDDLDPRVWPEVLASLLAAGAADAWLTPILMKKGRPAHTLSVLVPAARADDARRLVFTQTTSIGLRERPVTRSTCQRRIVVVEIGGLPIRVKVADWAGATVTVQPEYDDAVSAAAELGRPVADVIAEARALATARRGR